jgi:hypothetical protein
MVKMPETMASGRGNDTLMWHREVVLLGSSMNSEMGLVLSQPAGAGPHWK